MNKLLIVLLAVCLVSVHAFVKRDAPATTAPSNNINIDGIAKELNQIIQTAGNKLKDAFDPETLKKGFGDVVDGVHNTIAEFNKKNEK